MLVWQKVGLRTQEEGLNQKDSAAEAQKAKVFSTLAKLNQKAGSVSNTQQACPSLSYPHSHNFVEYERLSLCEEI